MENFPTILYSLFPEGDLKTLFQKGLAQVRKDFALQGLEISLDDSDLDFAGAVQQIHERISQLNQFQPHRLTSFIYQVDLSPSQILSLRSNNQDFGNEHQIAMAVLLRCMTKVYFRMKHNEGKLS